MRNLFSLGSLLVFIGHMSYMLYVWPTVPLEIPIQFKSGEVSSWGSKWLLFLVPVIGVVSWLFIHVLTRKPENMNYINLTEDNKHLMYQKGKSLSLVLKNSSLLLFLCVNHALLLEVIDGNTVVAISAAVVFGAISLLYPLYILFWMVLSSKVNP